ncbi:hypothetical protein EXS54_02920 [Patescibacteria group bacterium]|nr:hypothetical protein [Patescibacteria group bacterium]
MPDFSKRDLIKILTGALDTQFKRSERTFATKGDLGHFATKDDLSAGLVSLEKQMNDRFATKDDLKRFAASAKHDLARMEYNITTAVNQSQDAYVRRPEHTELKGRVAVLERKMSSDD